jgi:hypothetical protein
LIVGTILSCSLSIAYGKMRFDSLSTSLFFF